MRRVSWIRPSISPLPLPIWCLPKLAALLATVNGELEEARGAERYVQLLYLTHLFAWFGAIHPFLDGNGHIQRALFAAAAAELSIPMSSRFALHPRSFDRLLAHQLEIFTRTNGPQSHLAAIAEYLAFWLAGPFDMPGSGISNRLIEKQRPERLSLSA